MLQERIGDARMREEAEVIIDLLSSKAGEATFYAGVSRIYLPEQNVILVMSELEMGEMAKIDQRDGYYLVLLDFPTLSRRLLGKNIRIKDLDRASVRRFLKVFLKSNILRSLIVHELVHVMMRKKGIEYRLGDAEWRVWDIGGKKVEAHIHDANDNVVILFTGEKTIRVKRNRLTKSDSEYVTEWIEENQYIYANNPEEVSSWFNQAVYDLEYRSRNNPRIIGSNPSEFTDSIINYLDSHGWWDLYTEDTKRRIRKRAYTTFQRLSGN